MAIPHELERSPYGDGAHETDVDLFPDCSPAGGTIAVFDFTGIRHIPLTALRQI